ncbi:MAG: Heterodimeric efflux ABC transporter, permease/ATP-binding subunit 2 [uncultured Rubrobacteraceae bacterium]|uniref:Fatty acid ABC transporter ATP-binding/permease protein n=1 Tax=uncultured Rubrobacteraceae bacterium TaxID=349277 RepID=A0A6J4QI12_9ACTN|nr:MAG: Heterodimeric efflux ABC transporter, permease/ATP-binding subunit 2 [uncultured Rubrobacteraceae bacterium]
MRRLKSYLLKFPLLRLFTFAAPYKARLLGLGFVTVLVTAASLSEPLIIGYAIDEGLVAGSLRVIYAMVAAYVFVNLATWALSYVQTIGMGWIGQHMILDIRNALFGHLQSLSLQFYSEQKAGWIISRLTNDIENFNTLLNDGVQNLVKNGLTLIGVFIAIFFVDWRLALATISILPVMVVGTTVFRIESWKAYRAAREAVAEVAAHLQENVSGMRVVQAFTGEKRSSGRFDERNRSYRRANARTTLLSAVYFPGVELLGSVGLGVVLLYGGFRVVNGEMSVGELVAFVGLLNMFFQPIQQLSQLYSDLQSTLASLEKVFAVLDTESDRADSSDAKDLRALSGDVEFDRVSFAYGEDVVLDDVSFRIKPGETLAIVGETGAGKSTVVKLLSRFYDPTGGRVRIDGQDLRDVRGSSLRRYMGVVLQDTFLFTGTIKDNIRYGRPDATDEEIIAAAKTVGADEFIRRFPEGYETQVRERGGRLSVGERQLVAFARALLADPKLLVLDEATSSVDLATEARIEAALDRLLAGRTSIVIAHRLSTVRRANRILVMGEGRVIEEGTHEELLSRPSAYRRLYESQFAA